MKTKQILDEMPAYLRMQIFASDDVNAGVSNYMADRTHWQETIEIIENLDEEKIVQELARGKINASLSAFMRHARKHTSAWALSEEWRKKVNRPLNSGDDAFLRLAVCELWKRRLPGRPSIEMLDDWMQEGYTAWMATDDRSHACDLWDKVWQVIRSRLKPEMRCTDDATKVFLGTQCIHDWLQDFLLEGLQNAAYKEPRFAEIGITLCKDILKQFPDDNELSIESWRGDLGTFYYLANRFEEGECVFQNLIHDFPDHATNYICFADILGYGPRNNAPIDLPRAIELIKEAIDKPVADAADYDLPKWLHDFEHPRNNGGYSNS